MDKLFDYPVSRGSEVAWKTKGGESIKTVRKVMSRYTPLVTRMNYEEHGQLWDQTIYSADDAAKAKGVGYVAVNTSDPKMSDVAKYGGYKKYTGAYFFLVEHTKKGKKVRSLEAMPLYLKDSLDSKEKIEAYCREKLGYQEPSVRIEKIKMYSLIKVDGFLLYLTGRTGNQLNVINAVEMKLPNEWNTYVKRLFSSSTVIDSNNDISTSGVLISKEKNISLYSILAEKHCAGIYSKRPNPIGTKLKDWKDKFEELPVDKQVYVLKQIMQLSSNSNQGADLQCLGGAAKTGVSLLNKVISGYKEFVLVSYSPTGIYKSEHELLTI